MVTYECKVISTVEMTVYLQTEDDGNFTIRLGTCGMLCEQLESVINSVKLGLGCCEDLFNKLLT